MMRWRTAGVGLTSLGAPIDIGIAHPLIGTIAFGVELGVALTIVGTALFGSQAFSERAFRLLRRGREPAPAPGPRRAGRGIVTASAARVATQLRRAPARGQASGGPDHHIPAGTLSATWMIS